jgi:hypothetical protein
MTPQPEPALAKRHKQGDKARRTRVQKYSLTDIKGRVQKFTLSDIDLLCSLSYTSRQGHTPLLQTCSNAKKKRFLKECRKTLEFAAAIESWLKGWLLPSIIPIVNSMSINLKLPPGTRKLNSCLIVAPRGSGKSELLEHILARSNPEHFVVLPQKMFESELVKKTRDYFHGKIVVHDDLIIAFEGMSTKQRQQLVNFWTKLLEGSYARDRDALSKVSTLALFGLASEELDRFRDELMSATFLDRIPPFKHNVTRQMKKEILQFRARSLRENPSRQPPIIKLPLPEKIEDDKKVEVDFPDSKEIEDRIAECALELDDYQVQSYARAQDYIKTFMRANALLNGRHKVTISDLLLYDLVHPLFLNSMGELGTENRVLSLIKKYPDRPDKEIIKMGGLSRGTFYRYKKILQGKGLI